MASGWPMPPARRVGRYFGGAGLPHDRTPGAISVPDGVNVFPGAVDWADCDARAAVAVAVGFSWVDCAAAEPIGAEGCWLLLTTVGGSSTVVPPSTSIPVSYTGWPLAGS